MNDDPVMMEVRKIKQELSARFGHDVRKLGEHLMREQEKVKDRHLIQPPKKTSAA